MHCHCRTTLSLVINFFCPSPPPYSPPLKSCIILAGLPMAGSPSDAMTSFWWPNSSMMPYYLVSQNDNRAIPFTHISILAGSFLCRLKSGGQCLWGKACIRTPTLTSRMKSNAAPFELSYRPNSYKAGGFLVISILWFAIEHSAKPPPKYKYSHGQHRIAIFPMESFLPELSPHGRSTDYSHFYGTSQYR